MNGKQLINALSQEWVDLDVEIGISGFDSDGTWTESTPSGVTATSHSGKSYVTMDTEFLDHAKMDQQGTVHFWKNLLAKYIDHVIDREGIDFLHESHMDGKPFTGEELSILRSVEEDNDGPETP